MQAVGDITFETQLAAGRGDIQQFAVDWRLEFFAAQFNADQLRQFQCGTEGIAALVVGHCGRQCAAVAAMAVNFADAQRGIALPGDTHTIMKALDPERLAVLQVALTVARDHFIKRQAIAFAVDLDHIALEALAAFVEGDDQRVMALLQRPQVGGDFQRSGEHLWWLRSFCFIEHG
ncbi:hypothetical protein D9M71_450780 [compost metagenome]